MTHPGAPDDARLEQFLDGLLSPEEAAELRASPPTAEAAERQGLVDAAIRRRFRPAAAPPDLLGALRSRENRASRSSRLKYTGLALAALIALSFSAWMNWETFFPAPTGYPGEDQPWRDVVTVYHDTLREGFEPEWVCKDDEEFQRAVDRRLGQPLLLAQTPGLTAVGWTYANTITKRTMCLLVTANHSAAAEIKPGAPDAKIIVFVDRSGVGNQPATGPRGQLSLFSRAVGKLVAYELTPLTRPLVLDQLYVP